MVAGDTLAAFEKMRKLFFQMSIQVYSLLGQTEGKRKTFYQRVQEGGLDREITLKSTWLLLEIKKVCLFVEFEIIPPLLCCILDPLSISTAGHGVL